ncbi:MAG TPA: rhomboid family intramembrane serine protease [Candidatus Binatia bacterium]|nr:rhomboid family intramembrane serine protease [Candidatus Binatia bacterium]
MTINTFLILVCTVASLWAWQQDARFIEQNLIFSFNNLMAGRFWTLPAALFVHASLFHLIGNMVFLMVFGGTLQKSVGSGRFLLVFLTGGLTGFVLSMPFMAPGAGMLGASAAIFTVAACVMLVRPLKFSWLFLAPQGLVALIYFLYNVVIVYDPKLVAGYDPRVGYIAHIIGFVTGIPFGIAWSRSWKKNLVITIILLGVYIGLLYMALRYLRQ